MLFNCRQLKRIYCSYHDIRETGASRVIPSHFVQINIVPTMQDKTPLTRGGLVIPREELRWYSLGFVETFSIAQPAFSDLRSVTGSNSPSFCEGDRGHGWSHCQGLLSWSFCRELQVSWFSLINDAASLFVSVSVSLCSSTSWMVVLSISPSANSSFAIRNLIFNFSGFSKRKEKNIFRRNRLASLIYKLYKSKRQIIMLFSKWFVKKIYIINKKIVKK